jgi:hypothetical protein
MAQLMLYHAAPSRSSIVRWMLEELGEPYDIHLVSFKNGETRAPEYLAINPMGKVPALRQAPDSRVALYVIPTDEELMIARHTLAALRSKISSSPRPSAIPAK